MDVDGTTFYTVLPEILNDIGQSLFVAIDLELSGVPLKQSRTDAQSTGKQTVQQRYQSIRLAAEKYQILQVGLTCVRRDDESGRYICKPYNVPISPLLRFSGLDVERDIVFSSSAASFLRSVSFDFSTPFDDGVPYLTSREEHDARERFRHRNGRPKHAMIDVKNTDVDSLALLDNARREINHWQSTPRNQRDDFLNIGPAAYHRPGEKHDSNHDMTKYEKRLIHQLVEVEFPVLKTISRKGFIQVVHVDKNEELFLESKRQTEFDHRLARQRGFDWIVDALLGKQLQVDTLVQLVYEAAGHDVDPKRRHTIRRSLHASASRLLGHPTVMIGHNCFLDLIYLYETFLGTLPDTVEDFTANLHEAFPLIVDTKYMATQDCGDIPPHSSLEDLVVRLQSGAQTDEVHSAHDKYADTACYHEAGYDSLMTAQVAIRLSYQLEAVGTYVDNGETGRVRSSSSTQKGSNVVSKVVDKSVGAISTTLASLGFHKKSEVPTSPASSSTDQNPANDGLAKSPAVHAHQRTSQSEATAKRMPTFQSDFWRVYGNHLRIFGTEEGVLRLASQ